MYTHIKPDHRFIKQTCLVVKRQISTNTVIAQNFSISFSLRTDHPDVRLPTTKKKKKTPSEFNFVADKISFTFREHSIPQLVHIPSSAHGTFSRIGHRLGLTTKQVSINSEKSELYHVSFLTTMEKSQKSVTKEMLKVMQGEQHASRKTVINH